jgi:hypothetical protein
MPQRWAFETSKNWKFEIQQNVETVEASQNGKL